MGALFSCIPFRISPAGRKSSKMEILQKSIQDQLILLAKGSKEPDSETIVRHSSVRHDEEIIVGQDLMKFWREPRRSRFYTEMPWYHLIQNENEKSIENYLKILSVLIQINYTEWDSFDQAFIKNQRSDADIPFSREELVDVKFLGPGTGDLFYKTQWVYCPLIIKRKQEPLVLKDKDLDFRFPFVNAGRRVGVGAYGVVHGRVIAARHLVSTQDGTENSENQEVAVKVITESRFLVSELENHKSISRCLTKHTNIMANIATIIKSNPLEGNVYHIFYELAAYDVEEMLTRDWATNRRKRHRSAPSKRNGSYELRASYFIVQSRHLADALDFLHNRLYRNAQVSLAHNDLTPRNILVFFPDDADSEVKYPVGQWKIADFGLSKINDKKKSQNETSFSAQLHPNDKRLAPDLTRHTTTCLSLTPAKRPPGKYTPPEIGEDGNSELNAKMGDVWAFGAIFSEILAYAIGEDKLVKDSREIFENDKEDRFFDPLTKRLKMTFTTWISKLPEKSSANEQGRKWIEECVKLIKKILVREASKRYSASRIRDMLQVIHELHMMGKEQSGQLLSIDTSVTPSGQGSRPESAHSGNSASPEELHDNLSTTNSDSNIPKSLSFQHKVVQY